MFPEVLFIFSLCSFPDSIISLTYLSFIHVGILCYTHPPFWRNISLVLVGRELLLLFGVFSLGIFSPYTSLIYLSLYALIMQVFLLIILK